jgi:hypothetical protein
MSKTRQILILAIIGAGAAAGLLAINPFRTSSVQANQAGTSGAQKWEYCAITNVTWASGGLSSRPVAVIRYFQVGGEKEEAVEFAPAIGKSAGLKDACNKAIAKLGDEGWEMILRAPDNGYVFYFKRPKQ